MISALIQSRAHALRRAGATITAATSLLIVSPVPLRAFSYKEHCRTSNIALAIAINHLRARLQERDTEQHLQDLTRFEQFAVSSCRIGRDTSFGDVTALVDYALSPTDLFLVDQNPAARDETEEGILPGRILRDLGRSRLRNARAAHLNEDHFADRALYTYWFWHSAAVRLASDQKHLGAALVLEAYAEHFLEDSFAPGHILTPRRDFHDAPSLGMHNFYNRHGALYYPRHTDSLTALIEPTVPSELASVLGIRDGQGLQSVAIDLAGEEKTGIRMFGDGEMETHPDEARFIALVVARSAADVLESALLGATVNSFTNYEWQGYTFVDGIRLSPRAQLPFGEFEVGEDSRPLVFDPLVALSVGTESIIGPGGSEGRATIAAEILVAGMPGNKWISTRSGIPPWGRVQWGLMLGGGWSAGGSSGSFGPSARVVFPVNLVNSQVSVFVSPREYYAHHAHTRGIQTGIRGEIGMGLVFMGFGVARDLSVRHDGTFHPSVELLATVSGGFPMPIP